MTLRCVGVGGPWTRYVRGFPYRGRRVLTQASWDVVIFPLLSTYPGVTCVSDKPSCVLSDLCSTSVSLDNLCRTCMQKGKGAFDAMTPQLGQVA